MEDRRVQISFKLNPEVEEDKIVIDVLEDQENKQGFIKALILSYYKRGKMCMSDYAREKRKLEKMIEKV